MCRDDELQDFCTRTLIRPVLSVCERAHLRSLHISRFASLGRFLRRRATGGWEAHEDLEGVVNHPLQAGEGTWGQR